MLHDLDERGISSFVIQQLLYGKIVQGVVYTVRNCCNESWNIEAISFYVNLNKTMDRNNVAL